MDSTPSRSGGERSWVSAGGDEPPADPPDSAEVRSHFLHAMSHSTTEATQRAEEVRMAHAAAEVGPTKGLMLAEKEGVKPPTPTPDKTLQCLALQDKQGTWHPADGRIVSDELVITSEHVAEPAMVAPRASAILASYERAPKLMPVT